MAILGECEVQIIVDGTPAKEYDDNEEEVTDNDKTVTKYVEAAAGSHFAVKSDLQASYNFTQGEDSVTTYVEVDGHHVTSGLLLRGRFLNQRARGYTPSILIAGHIASENGAATLYQFQFSDLETRDLEKADDLDKYKEKYGQLGTIVVRVWREQTLGRRDLDAHKARDTESIPEKALKGRPLDVATRMVRSRQNVDDYMSFQTRALDKQALATFVFKYRTKRALQSLLIIERSPTPVPVDERPLDELSREELQDLVRRQREEQAIKKQENGGIKRERSETVTVDSRPLKSSKGVHGQTIYHIDSDDEERTPTRDEAEVVENDVTETNEDIEVVQL